MVNVNFHMEKVDYEVFKSRVGDRNVSVTLRNYALSYVESTNLNERKMIKQFEIIDKEKKAQDSRPRALKLKIDKLENDRQLAEIKRLDEEQKERDKMEDIGAQTHKKDLYKLVP